MCADGRAEHTRARIHTRFAITMCLLWDSSDGSICTLKVLDCFDLLEPINSYIQYHTEQNNCRGHYGFLSRQYQSHKANARQHYFNIIPSKNKTKQKTGRCLKNCYACKWMCILYCTFPELPAPTSTDRQLEERKRGDLVEWEQNKGNNLSIRWLIIV